MSDGGRDRRAKDALRRRPGGGCVDSGEDGEDKVIC